VTTVDREAERLILDTLRRAFPDHGMVAEESTAEPGCDEHQWYVDPLDGRRTSPMGIRTSRSRSRSPGTRSSYSGWCTTRCGRRPFTAVRGGGARLNGAPIAVSDTAVLERALIATGFPYDRREHGRFYLGFWEAVMARAQDVRRGGSAALDLCYVASGVSTRSGVEAAPLGHGRGPADRREAEVA